MNTNSNAPFDSRIIIAVIAFFIFYFAWQNYLTKKYPGYGQPTVKNNTSEAPAPVPTANEKQLAPEQHLTEEKAIALTPEKKLKFTSDKLDFEVSSFGMGITNVAIKTYTDKDGGPIRLGQSEQERLFEMRIGSNQNPIHFDVAETSSGTYFGVAQIGNMKIERQLKFNAEKDFFENKIKITQPDDNILRGISFLIPEKIHTPKSTSIFFPSYEHQDLFVVHSDTKDLVNFSRSKEDIHQRYDAVKVLALGSQYFASALLDKSDIIPEVSFNSKTSEQQALATVTYKPAQQSPLIELEQVMYVGAKSMEALSGIDKDLSRIVDFGKLSFIAHPLLYTMKQFYSFFQNWGVAIILLTLLVRFIVLPFNLFSYKSMRAMQKIQPQMASLRERYKEDPTRMHQETMALMKQNKANPLGGCLPMLVQIPIFFALYQVIGSSIELYQSPFYFWISDLSSHDKFYVLPILMGLTMFIQQKMTPTAMDPMQAKILAFLPVVFTLFMLQLPSGLTLYMFVSALFGIIQQWFMIRDRKAQEAQ